MTITSSPDGLFLFGENFSSKQKVHFENGGESEMCEDVVIQIVKLINPEAERSKMLEVTPDGVRSALRNGTAKLIECNGLVISYANFVEWPGCLEIGSVITRKEFRGQGFATRAVTEVISAVKVYSEKPLIALTNHESTGLFRKLGFQVRPNKDGVSTAIWDPCVNCLEFPSFPRCHCHLMVLH